MVKMGRRPQRPVLIVDEGPLDRRAGVENERVEAVALQHLGGQLREGGCVRAMQVREGLLVHCGEHTARTALPVRPGRVMLPP